MDESVIEGLFENGLMAVEIPEKYGGAEMGFGAAIVAIEELAKVDPSVSVLCDVHVRLSEFISGLFHPQWRLSNLVEHPCQHCFSQVRVPSPYGYLPPRPRY